MTTNTPMEEYLVLKRRVMILNNKRKQLNILISSICGEIDEAKDNFKYIHSDIDELQGLLKRFAHRKNKYAVELQSLIPEIKAKANEAGVTIALDNLMIEPLSSW